MQQKSHTRWDQLKAIWSQGVIARWIALAWGAYGIFAAIRGEFLSAALQDKIRGVALIGPALNVPPTLWLGIFSLIMAAWIFEASYRSARATHEKLAAAIVQSGGVRRFVTTDAESYDADADDRFLTIRRARQSNFCIKLPPNPKADKEIEIKLGSGDKTLTVTIDGNGHMIDGQPDTWMNGVGTLRGFRFSGAEWEIY